ncbi:MAG: C40 family peptidase [Tannerella sp.]|jgi:cell wall-associated NlpC family hydrolase|nr:C40 family peptidase [Tannerella sp.]
MNGLKRNALLTGLLFLMAGVCLSCAARRQGSSASAGVYSAKQAAKLSVRLGVRVTRGDNLALYNTVAGWIGTPYRWGQSSRKGTDCSGFVSVVYREVYGKTLARSSAAMLRQNCRRVRKKRKLREGDLVFFHTGKDKRKVSHVGVYLKDGKFIHASTSRGVTVSGLEEPYYAQRWISGGVVK